ncbi:TonB-dependent receptor [Agaribacter marinus]|uniref:TonB-dependent receptor n=1 Tax=Agaribacter marinus TaxID=1431249 RepID=UPI0024E06432|nr:TonB-dependent receptor [Agaribacter marinus]
MRSSRHFAPSLLAKSIALVLSTTAIAPVVAQEDDAPEVIKVRGIRGSLQESMSIKRDSKGVVDAISAEDIGKFPDTNLAESLQRISGVSINRNNGEGQNVTVRGFGADKNMVTLNGRMMPAASAYGSGGGTSRAFDFGNLASESVRAVEVYKTGKASIATGGIGATINIKTAKPLDSEGFQASVGAKIVHDTTVVSGDDFTPELSGIFSFANDDSTWGVGLTLSHQTRHSGSSRAGVGGWRFQEWSPEYNAESDTFQYDGFGIADGPNGEQNAAYTSSRIINAPAEGQLFGVPNDLRFYHSDFERDRTNAQVTFQFAPTDDFVATMDYTYAKNELLQQEAQAGFWLTRSHDTITFDTDQPVATGVLITENPGGTKDNTATQIYTAQANELKSIGLNLEYALNDDLIFNFDFHDSSMESLPDDLGGSNIGQLQAGLASPVGLSQSYDFTGEFPLIQVTTDDCVKSRTTDKQDLPACNGVWDTTDVGTNYARVRSSAQKTDISQIKFEGSYVLDDGQFDFGIETRAMEMRQLQSNSTLKQGDWGIANPGELPAGLIEEFDILGQFEDYDTSNTGITAFRGNAVDIMRWGLADYGYPFETEFQTTGVRDHDHTVEEDTFSAYLQYSVEAEVGGMPTNVLAGVRYESTDVTSTSIQAIPLRILWTDNNDFTVVNSTDTNSVTEEHNYNHVLPSLDIDISLTDKIKARMSFGQTIARANYNQLRASVSGIGTDAPTLIGSTPRATASNPGLVPLLSNNFDLSFEYYFADTSYVSIGYFDKRVSNFIGNEQVELPQFDLRDATAGPRAQAAWDALNSIGVTVEETSLFVMTAILDNPQDFPNGAADYLTGVAQAESQLAFSENIATAYDITPNSDDPQYQFLTSRPINNRDANLYGAEFAAQHFFGDTGFGLSANYTLVNGDVKYDNSAAPNISQFALTGLSDSANVVAMYENHGIQARLAYNWRDTFLTQAGRTPRYTEDYSQWDFSVSYNINENATVSFEGINITDEDQRTHSRSVRQVWNIIDLGARYQLSARYAF